MSVKIKISWNRRRTIGRYAQMFYNKVLSSFYVLLTVHLDVILVNDQLDALFSIYLFHAPTSFEQQVLIIRRIKLCHYIIWYNTL